jgi:hypothetical protein
VAPQNCIFNLKDESFTAQTAYCLEKQVVLTAALGMAAMGLVCS